ncbi:MAG TPA: CDP-archaeol synthase [Ruminiclostridium sp.]|nr:CDP-archaeol synthase [Acetivibrio saccincola]HAA43086.1 CDP-archaeol synthase [Ruminiclostridium sp.]
MYITLFPVILAGIFNMIWCKAPIFNFMKKPIDGGMCIWDGKRLFGDNKTWKGFFGMMLGGTFLTIIWGLICGTNEFFEVNNFMYATRENTIGYNGIMGLSLGFVYAVFELPNSFIKRRVGITPGKTAEGFKKVIFMFIDQIDSILGCVLVVNMVYKMPLWFYFFYVLMGAVTHIVINILLYSLKLRDNMF